MMVIWRRRSELITKCCARKPTLLKHSLDAEFKFHRWLLSGTEKMTLKAGPSPTLIFGLSEEGRCFHSNNLFLVLQHGSGPKVQQNFPSSGTFTGRNFTVQSSKWHHLSVDVVCTFIDLIIVKFTRIFCRPVDKSGNRLDPAAFNQYRKSHQFRGPFCLCSLKFENQTTDVEAAVYMAKSGICLGEYVSSCAQNNCGYFGQSMFLV